MIKAIVIEDEPVALTQLKDCLLAVPDIELVASWLFLPFPIPQQPFDGLFFQNLEPTTAQRFQALFQFINAECASSAISTGLLIDFQSRLLGIKIAVVYPVG